MTGDVQPAAVPRPSLTERLARPGVIAALWAASTLVDIVGQIRFPDYEYGWHFVSSVLFLASLPMLAALVAAGFGRARDAVLPLAGSLFAIWLAFGLGGLAVQFGAGAASDVTNWTLGIAALLMIGLVTAVVVRILARFGASRRRRWASAALALSVIFIWVALSMFDEQFARVGAQYAAQDEPVEPPPDINEERLWTAQPALVDQALRRVPQGPRDTPGSFVVTIAAGGSQRLFGREARRAEAVLGRSFAAGGRSVILANDRTSLEKLPLATNTNLDAVLAGLAERMDPRRDLLIMYLAAHGNPNAELTTDLPDYTDLDAFGAARLAASLDRAGIRRRVIIISACYAGTWIKPLANDDTIVIAAARSDRTSFGCTDARELTYFGEALLNGPLASGASLARGFAAARRAVARWEAQQSFTPSEPQAFVGKNMAAVWDGKAR